MTYPTIAEVVSADREKLQVWWDDLRDPKTAIEERVTDLIFKKLLGLGVTPSCPQDHKREKQK